MRTVTSWDYIKDNYEPDDRLAVVIKRVAGQVIQRINTAERIAAVDFQRWLRFENVHGGNVYMSVNALRPEATGRTRSDVGAIRHVYLDMDSNGEKVLDAILRDSHVPQPSYVSNTSPGKFQTVWKVQGFTLEQAEALQRSMAATFGADRNVVDVARVLRLPGFYNKKYEQPHQVTAERLSTEVFGPSDFQLPTPDFDQPVMRRVANTRRSGSLSQSEHDWAETMRRLSRGEDPEAVRAWLESRRPDKSQPYYADLTVRKACAELDRRRGAQAELEI
jgi:hypothetical protein